MDSLIKKIKTNLITEYLLMVAIGLAISGLAGFSMRVFHTVGQQNEDISRNEIQEILNNPSSPSRQSALYLKLIERVGPEQAQEDLYRSGLPFNGNSHLVNHTVGDYLYAKYGNEGLVYCKEYFLASCYHGFTLHIVAGEKDKIFENVKEVMNACEAKGPYIVVQCAHAIGHGSLAYSGYKNLIDALALCDQIEKQVSAMPVIDCHDGVFMENIFGVHDGNPSADRWVSEEDLHYPCNDPRVKERYREACWRNQVTIMWPLLAQSPELVSEQCLRVENEIYKATCMHGVARAIQLDSRDDTDFIVNKCKSIKQEWQDFCLQTAATTAFAFGDHASITKICKEFSHESQQADCRNTANEMVISLVEGQKEQIATCREFEQSDQDGCIKQVREEAWRQ